MAADSEHCDLLAGGRPRAIRRIPVSAILLGLFLAFSGPVHAVEPGEILADARLEARARAISQKLRCVVCQNQSIDDSNAPLAKDLRVLVRERLTAGDTDGQAIGYIVARYGSFVLLKPPVQFNTLLLWLGPWLLAGLAFLGFGRFLRHQPVTADPGAVAALSADEEARLAALLEQPADASRDETRPSVTPARVS